MVIGKINAREPSITLEKISYIETKNVTFDKNIYIIYISKIQMSFTVSVLLACTKQNYIQTHHFIP